MKIVGKQLRFNSHLLTSKRLYYYVTELITKCDSGNA